MDTTFFCNQAVFSPNNIVQMPEGGVKLNIERQAAQDRAYTAADLTSARAQLAERQIRAPFSGQLGLRQISVGTLVTPGTVLTTLDDLASVNLDFNVAERYLADLKIGAEINANADAYPDQTFKATVTTIAARIDPTSRSVTVRAKAANHDGLLRPGMLLKLNLINRRHQGLAIAEEALLQVGEEQFVFVIKDDDSIERRIVSSGLRADGQVEITSGLQAGEQIVVRGTQKVRPGARVQRSQEPWAATVEARWERAAGAMGHQAPWLGGHESRVPTAREPRRQDEGVRGEGNPRAEAPDDAGLA